MFHVKKRKEKKKTHTFMTGDVGKEKRRKEKKKKRFFHPPPFSFLFHLV